MNKLPVPTEYQECLWLVEYLDILVMQGKVRMYSHIPNSTFTKSWTVKVKNKLLGVSPGVPDYLILMKDSLLFIEMKRTKGGVVSPEQKAWIGAFNQMGIPAHVAKGFGEAKEILDKVSTLTE